MSIHMALALTLLLISSYSEVHPLDFLVFCIVKNEESERCVTLGVFAGLALLLCNETLYSFRIWGQYALPIWLPHCPTEIFI